MLMARRGSDNEASAFAVGDESHNLRNAYKRAAISLALAAALWLIAYLVARDSGWEERSLLIPIAAGGLSALFFSLYRREK
jgi:hypothetical protein